MRILESRHNTIDQGTSEAHAMQIDRGKIKCFYDEDNSCLFWTVHPYKLVNRVVSILVCAENGMFLVLVCMKFQLGSVQPNISYRRVAYCGFLR